MEVIGYLAEDFGFYLPLIICFALFGIGAALGFAIPGEKNGKVSCFFLVLTVPLSAVFLIGLTIPFGEGPSGAGAALGPAIVYIAVIMFWPIPVATFSHLGWVVGRAIKGQGTNEFDSIRVETSGDLQKQIEEARDKVAHLRRFAERPSATLNEKIAHEVASRRLMALELKKKAQ